MLPVSTCLNHQDIQTFIAGAAGLNWAFESSAQQKSARGWKCHLRFPKQFAFPQAGSTSDSSKRPWLRKHGAGAGAGRVAALACSAGCVDLSPLGVQAAGADLGADLFFFKGN